MSYTEDPVFDTLQKIRGGNELCAVFATAWEAWSGRPPAAIDMVVGRCDYHPFDHGLAAVRVFLTSHGDAVVDLEVVVKVFAVFACAERVANTCRQRPVAFSAGPPVFTYKPWCLVGWTLPNGPDLRELESLLRPGSLLNLLNDCDGNSLEPENYGRPVLQRYIPSCKAALLWRARSNRPTLFAQLRDHQTSMGAYSNLAKVHAASQHGELGFRTPVPIGYHPGLHTFLFSGLPGTRLSDLMREGPVTAFSEAGRAIASLHRSKVSPSNLRTGSQANSELAKHIRDIGLALPELAPRLTEVVNELSRCGDTITETMATPIHGNLTCGKLLYQDAVVGLFDWDSLALGNPLQDVGQVAAHMALLVGQGTVSAPRALACTEAFGRGYREAIGAELDSVDLAGHVAASLIRHGRLRSLQPLARGWASHIHFIVGETERALAGTSAYTQALLGSDSPCFERRAG